MESPSPYARVGDDDDTRTPMLWTQRQEAEDLSMSLFNGFDTVLNAPEPKIGGGSCPPGGVLPGSLVSHFLAFPLCQMRTPFRPSPSPRGRAASRTPFSGAPSRSFSCRFRSAFHLFLFLLLLPSSFSSSSLPPSLSSLLRSPSPPHLLPVFPAAPTTRCCSSTISSTRGR